MPVVSWQDSRELVSLCCPSRQFLLVIGGANLVGVFVVPGRCRPIVRQWYGGCCGNGCYSAARNPVGPCAGPAVSGAALHVQHMTSSSNAARMSHGVGRRVPIKPTWVLGGEARVGANTRTSSGCKPGTVVEICMGRSILSAQCAGIAVVITGDAPVLLRGLYVEIARVS